MALISLWCIYHFPSGLKITLPAGSWLLIAGVILWSLPLLWTPRADWRWNALPKVMALWGMAGFYILLLCTTSCGRLRSRWLFILVVATLIQAGYALWQLGEMQNLPGGRPYASFQQANVLASFLATGLVCALWLFLQNGTRIKGAVTGITLFLVPVILIIVQSRAGQLGALLSTLILMKFSRRHSQQRMQLAILLIGTGIGLGVLWLGIGHEFFPNLTPALVNKEGSNFHRLTMLKLTWQLILNHPFTGNGYGSFEAIYGQLARLNPPGLETNTLVYPHNEFLYAWVEGGVVAVTGILLMLLGILRRLWSEGGAKWAGVAFLLPIAVHMNLEYPLYQSATHGLTLIMLLVVCGRGIGHAKSARCVTEASQRNSLPRYYGWAWRSVASLLSVVVFIFMVTGLQTQQKITQIEQQGLLPLVFQEQNVMLSLLNPYSQSGRLDFDRHVALLIRFNQTHDFSVLEQFRGWAERYLQVHNDPQVYFSLLKISRVQNLPSAEALCREAKGRWQNDPHFICK